VARTLPCQGRGRRFESGHPLQNYPNRLCWDFSCPYLYFNIHFFYTSPGGGIGIRTGLKILGRKACGFDSHLGHHFRVYLFCIGVYLFLISYLLKFVMMLRSARDTLWIFLNLQKSGIIKGINPPSKLWTLFLRNLRGIITLMLARGHRK
jgi:hypothetical protein